MAQPPAGPFRVDAVAAHVGGTLSGPAERLLTGVASLETAGPSQLSFVSNRRYVRKLSGSQAGCVLVAPGLDVGDRCVIRCADPYLAFAQALALFHPTVPPQAGIDPRAHVGEGAVVQGARIEAFAWVGAGAIVGPGTWVEAHAVVGRGASVGRDCRLMPGSVLAEGCVLGDRVWLNPGAVVGGEGFGFAPTPAGHVKIPQVGRAVIEDDVEIGANSCVDRAALHDTVVRKGARLDNLVQVGHAAEVGEHSVMVAYSGVAGSTKLGRFTTLAAKAAVLGHLELGDGVQVGVASAVHGNLPDGAKVTGVPAIEHKRWLRAAASFGELPALRRRVRQLEARLAQLEQLLPTATGEDPS